MASTTTSLHTPSGTVVINKIGHGLMSMTLTGTIPDEQCFAAIKGGVDSLPEGVKMFLNGGEFYGPNANTANLEMLSRFFEKYPEYADKTFLSVKGGINLKAFSIDGSEENTKASIENVLDKLRGKKKLDLYQFGRVDKNVPLETTLDVMAQYVKEGKVGSIGMSEVRAETLLRGHKFHPVTAVEIEVSPWEYGSEQKKVIEVAKENNIAVIAYSPIGRGFLSGEFKKFEDLPENDRRRQWPRFQKENFEKNVVIVDQLQAISKPKGITPAQLSIAWVSTLGPHVVPLPGSARTDRTLENLASNNVTFTTEELAKVNEVVENAAITVQGDRYPEAHMAALWA
ncbi:aldo keto reductase [Coniophora puteana RWD-64-598 SS2]|uniref:Aldo keto reductase n=1 Tax=Coniophora puteana (strain RWD-64-598) TaxID=741705 RepID=R7SEP4_CONPW|nr:aldo keto reductase [Coniophora puteana RWD-64-598 SS2]EIW74187.1 aldo keto reductase [Coniophora puteana RWD-64-598 SS2]